MRSLILSVLLAGAVLAAAGTAADAQERRPRIYQAPSSSFYYPVPERAPTEPGANVYTVVRPEVRVQPLHVYVPVEPRPYSLLGLHIDPPPVERHVPAEPIWPVSSRFNPNYYPWIYRDYNYPRYPMTWPW